MLQNHFFDIEPQVMCGDCSQAVTNPLCPFCLSIEVEAWLTLYPNLRRQLLPKIRKFLDRIEDRAYDSTRCIKCNEESTEVCPYCFTDFVLKELQKMNVASVILSEFLEFFNYDLDHCGYYREAEDLGLV